MVETDEGLVAIEAIAIGDKVFSEDPETGEQGYFEVTDLTNHPTDEILEITIAYDTGAAQSISDEPVEDHQPAQDVMHVTPEHPIYVEGTGWLWAENLALGDRLRRADGGWAVILAIERVVLDEPVPVYNFTVEGPHTYFVLEAGLLVHNDRCIRYAPTLQSGFPRRLQRTIVDSLDEGDVIALRDRPYRAAGLEAKYLPKTGDITKDMILRGHKNGVRVLKDGRKVLSDLDVAGYTIYGRNVGDLRFRSENGFAQRFNDAYGYPIITHGTHCGSRIWNSCCM